MIILRISRPPKIFACLSNFKIYIDDVYSGYISTNEAEEINVENGEHSVYIKMGL
jgi:hypothetical protein